MSLLKLNGGSRAALVAFALLAASTQPARADTKMLACTGPDRPLPMTVELNEANGTVTIHDSGYLIGTVPAKFTETDITWELDGEHSTSRVSVTLSRTTGALTEVLFDKKNGGAAYATYVYACSVAQKRF
jgi:hypothetical protein